MHHTIEDVAHNQRLDLATAQQVATEKSAQYGIDDYGMISTFHVDDFIKEVRERMAAAGIPTPPYKWAANAPVYPPHYNFKPQQSQDSTFDQLTRLLHLANKNGLYDAAEWLQAQLTTWSAKWKRGKKALLLTASPWDNDLKPVMTITPEEYYGCPTIREIWGDHMGIPRLEGVNDKMPPTPSALRRRRDYNGKLYPGVTSSLLHKKADEDEDNPICICRHGFYDHNEQGICDICGIDGCYGFMPLDGDHKVNLTVKHKALGSFEQDDNVMKQSAGEHYVWEANGDQAVVISPDHDMRVLRYDDAQPFWAQLFELEEHIEDPEELQNAIDNVCKKYFETPADPTTYFYEPPKVACSPAQDEADAIQGRLNRLSADNYDPNATGYTNEPHDPDNHETGSRSHIGGKAPGELHNRVEKASETLAALWPQAPKAAQHGYAITHHLKSVQMLLKQALGQIAAYPELASQKISQAENTLRTATDEIKHLKL